MAITIFTGTPGSGKSYHAAREIHEALRFSKSYVITNFPIHNERYQNALYECVENDQLNPDLLVSRAVDFWSVRKFKEGGLLLVLDEAQLIFNSRTWNSADRLKWIQFFSQHRKLGYNVILIAQDMDMIDKQFRALLEYEVNHRKLGNYGMFGKVLSILMFGQYFYACKYYVGNKVKIDGEFIRFRKKIAAIYDSYGMFEGNFQLLEVGHTV